MQAHRLGNFDMEHHALNKLSFNAKYNWWRDEIRGNRRCGACWLRPKDCFCTSLDELKSQFVANASNDLIGQDLKVCMYYHYQELGRSANTAHVFEYLTSPINCESIVFGDVDAETKLVDEIISENKSGQLRTCILYPHSSATSLGNWIHESCNELNDSRHIRMVVLDGTYAQASRQWKYLNKAVALRGGQDIKLPVVKLDLDTTGCKSAIQGIMTQPGKEKICSYQAAVMALKQTGVSQQCCDALSQYLDCWLQHILRTGIKLGKRTQKRTADMKSLDLTPAAYVQEYMRRHTTPFYSVSVTNENLADQALEHNAKSKQWLPPIVPVYYYHSFCTEPVVSNPIITIIPSKRFGSYSVASVPFVPETSNHADNFA